MNAKEKLSRRKVLRGLLGGAAVTVALPTLECFLNPNGTAYAATGSALPPVFASWFYGLGLSQGHWEPKTVGTDWTLRDHIKVLDPIKAKINLFSGMHVFLDGKVNQNHYSGAQCQMTGVVSRTGSEYSTSLDTIIGNQIGKRARFRSLEVGCDGDRRSTWSARGANGLNPAEVSPLALYTRLFGPEFKDPNSANFEPDPTTMVRRSVLSGITEDRKSLMRELSTSDRARLDEYFTSVRDLEQQLSVELERPAPLPSCSVPPQVDGDTLSNLVDTTRVTHRRFAQLLAHALACGQTQIVNVAMGSGFSPLRMPDEVSAYHQLTHEEPVDPQLGAQRKCKWLAEQHMAMFREFVMALDSIKEGDSTLLDRAIVLAFTDHGEARLHSMNRIPVITAGSGGGRMKTGYHIAAEGDACTRVGLTIQHAFGIPAGSYGTETNRATKPFSELLV
jgi:hypothetical protein